jgi:hypothetical protein
MTKASRLSGDPGSNGRLPLGVESHNLVRVRGIIAKDSI